MKFEDKIIAITGGGQGLGLQTALYLVKEGAQLALIDLDGDKLGAAVELCIAAAGDRETVVRSYVANVADEVAVIDTFNKIVSDFNGLDVLVNNAGITRDGLLLKAKDSKVEKRMSLSQWQSVIDVNLTGVFLCGREAATKMVESGSGGVIVNIASISKAGNIGQTNYSAAKAGVEAITVTWAKELARYGIRTAAIAPGIMMTEMVANMKPEALAKMEENIPLKRIGQPEQIAQTVGFIVENDYISGRTIEVDGGLRL